MSAGTRRLLAVVTARHGRTHILVGQKQTVADLTMRAHPRETICGRKIIGETGEHLADEFGVAKDCKQCTLLAQSRGWID